MQPHGHYSRIQLNSLKVKPVFSSLPVRLVGTVFLAIAPALLLLYFTGLPGFGFAVGLLALVAAWYGGKRILLKQMHALVVAVQRLGAGDLTARTGLGNEPGEIGQLARAFDQMAATVEQRVKEREQAEQRLLNRALQQTAVAALGQFALVSGEFSSLLNQAVTLVAQTLDVEYCRVLELLPGGHAMLMRAGVGWQKDIVGIATVSAEKTSQAGYTLNSGEPVVIEDLKSEGRFKGESILEQHQIASGVSVAIITRERPFGILGVYSEQKRIFTNDDIQFLLSVANALAVAVERRRADAELQKLADFAKLNPNPAMELSAEAQITYSNDAASVLAKTVGCEQPKEILPPDIEDIVQSCLISGQSKLNIGSKKSKRELSWSFHPVPASRVVHCYVTDITDRLNLEAQLRQAQKMESVGQLAAGVAHDFNNMLTVIQGHAGMLLARPTLPFELRDSIQAVYFAAERAASLTRQLLMFSRKSVMQPGPIDLREIVANMTKMLKRLLGETITLEFLPATEISIVQGDTSMVEQVIMNLSVNARDAMPFGGQLAISIEPAIVDEVYARAHPEARAGNFVCLSISDTGQGMDEATQRRIFEPFFTTKEIGKGTGLGLATVYGIVKQHRGWIEVSSAVGQGATFNIFFPASDKSAKEMRKADDLSDEVLGGNETILIVEDEATVLAMGKLILQDCGYQVLGASSGAEALEVFEKRGGAVDLLVADIVMPKGMSGLDVAQNLVARKPDLKVVFTSGYSVDELETDFIRRGRGTFLQKPYTRSTLAKAVRERLDTSIVVES